MRILPTFAAVRAEAEGAVGLVPTMGFLHEAHLSLMEAAREECDMVVVSLFVNPLQFGPTEDLKSYPRDLDRDAALAEKVGVDLLFAPPIEEMYPVPAATRVTVPELTARLEGKHRPGHFDGVMTVVAKLLAGLRPDRAYFGRKDIQQLIVVRRMVADLSFPVEVVGLPTVREADGLALSSRNVFLGGDERDAALTLSRGLMRAADAAESGETRGQALEGMAMAVMTEHPGVDPDYVVLASTENVVRLDALEGSAFLAVAGRVGSVRLIDNVTFVPRDGRFVAERGTRLEGPSILYREG